MKEYKVILEVVRTEEKIITAPDDSTEEEVREYAENEYYTSKVISVEQVG